MICHSEQSPGDTGLTEVDIMRQKIAGLTEANSVVWVVRAVAIVLAGIVD
jgi:hypothetical protein